MSESIKDLRIPFPIEGVVRTAQINDTVTPENSVQLAVNLNFDCIGAMTTRLGVSTFATSLSGQINSFGSLSIQSTGVRRLFAQVGTDISMWDGASWTSVRTTTVTTKARFSQFLNYTFMCNGNDGDDIQASNGGSFSAVSGIVPAGMPKGDYIQAGFDGRLWVADKSTDALYFSDIVQFTPPSTYSLTYSSTNFIKNFSPQDGESITGLFRVPRALLLFKQNGIYRIYNSYSVDPYPAYNVGTYSQESIVQAKDGVYFHHSSGFYKFNYDGQPTEISRRIIDFVRAIPRSNYENITGSYDGKDAIEWNIGSVTVEGVTYSSCVVRYTISTQVWTIYDYGSHIFTSVIRYDNGTTIDTIVGTSTGLVGRLGYGYTDFNSPFYFDFIDRWRNQTDMYCHSKNISGIAIFADNASGTLLQYQSKKSPVNEWHDLDTLTEEYCSIFPNANTEDYNVSRLRMRGTTSGTPISFHGIEYLTIQDKGLDKN